jgi:type II secretory pathway pseudopilin PulG
MTTMPRDRRSRSGLLGEEGTSLVELLMAMAIMSIVVVVLGTTLSSIQRAAIKQDDLGQMNDQARLALEQIDHEMRSGNVLYDPDLENGGGADALASCAGCEPGYTMRIYTQANASTRTLSSPTGYVCVLWQIDTEQRLLTTSWPPDQPEDATPWRVVAEHVVNRDLGAPAFSLDTDPLKGGRTIDISLAVNADLEHEPDQTMTLQAAYTGRNTSYGYPVSVCQDTPT